VCASAFTSLQGQGADCGDGDGMGKNLIIFSTIISMTNLKEQSWYNFENAKDLVNSKTKH